MELLKLLLVTAIASVIPGQLVRIPFFPQSGAFTVSDILVVILAVVFLLYFLFRAQNPDFQASGEANLEARKREPRPSGRGDLFNKLPLVVPKNIVLPVSIFSLLAALSTFFALNRFSPLEILASSLFLIRFLLYFSVLIITLNVAKKETIESWLNVFFAIGTILVLLGFVQLLLVPNLLFLTPYGWDPHRTRIVSSFLDPNFIGIVFVFLASFSLSKYLYKKNLGLLLIFLFASIAVLLTFSRSSYLAFLCALFVIGILKSFKITSLTVLIFLLSFLIIPQARERVAGAITFDETAEARTESWQKALLVFADNFLIGVGFNTYRYSQASYGFFENDQNLGGHSGAGSDSSLLLVAATTGVFGLGAFIWVLVSIYKTVSKSAKNSFIALGTLASFTSLLVHSQFVNSLFFPQIMLLFWFFVGLTAKENT